MTEHLVTQHERSVLIKAEKEAAYLQKLGRYPDHTICKAMVLERSIFFVLLPFFRHGDAGLRSERILADEQIHVATTPVCNEPGLTPLQVA